MTSPSISEYLTRFHWTALETNSDRKPVEDAGTKRIDRLALGKKRHRGLAPFTKADADAVTGAQVVEDDHVLAVCTVLLAQRREAERNADDPAGGHQAWVGPRQRDGADHLRDTHAGPPQLHQSRIPRTIQRAG